MNAASDWANGLLTLVLQPFTHLENRLQAVNRWLTAAAVSSRRCIKRTTSALWSSPVFSCIIRNKSFGFRVICKGKNPASLLHCDPKVKKTASALVLYLRCSILQLARQYLFINFLP